MRIQETFYLLFAAVLMTSLLPPTIGAQPAATIGQALLDQLGNGRTCRAAMGSGVYWEWSLGALFRVG